MQQCSYCGAEYPDDATECAIDKTPLGDVPSEAPANAPLKLPPFGVFSERKIPVSLALVSYLFFSAGAGLFAVFGFFAFMMLFMVGDYGSNHILVSCLVGGVLAILVVCCLLIFPITMLVAGGIFAVFFTVYEIAATGGGWTILSRLGGVAIAILFVYISRGLRMGARGWRTCALVFIWLEFAMVAFGIVHYFLTGPHHQHEWAVKDWLECALGVLVLAWQYRVLARPDVRDLFGV